MKSQPFSFILLGWITGILLSTNVELDFYWSFRILFILLILLVISFRNYALNSIIIFTFFTVSSLLHFQSFNQFTLLKPQQLNSEQVIKLEVLETYRSSEKFKKYKAKVIQIDTLQIEHANALLYWNKENENLNIGDQIWTLSKIQLNEAPKNPHQFDYANYLKRQRIHYTIFSGNNFLIEKSPLHFYAFASDFKLKMRSKLLENGYSTASVDIIGAMLLGDRTEMNPELEDIYRKTGVVHILSISGLHIVMIYTIFFTLFFPLTYLPKGKFIRILCSLIFIWIYALFVEFQPPVARSAFMITIYYVTVLLNRTPNVYHTLSLTAFLLLIYNPNFLFDVGFQLSFSAVFFIVWLMPVFQKLLPTRNKTLGYCRDFVGTSVSAQLGTFPFAAYYFHQSSALFLFGNVLMIPASFLMIISGLISIFLEVLNLKFDVWVHCFNHFIHGCNDIIEWLAGFRSLVFESIMMTKTQVILLLIGIISIRFLVLKFQAKWVISILLVVFSLESFRVYQLISFRRKQEIVIFHQYKNSIIGIRSGTEMDLFVSNLADTVKFHSYVIKPYLINERINKHRYLDLQTDVKGVYQKTGNLIVWNDLKISWINQNDFNYETDFGVDYLILMNSPQLKQDSIRNQTQIIIDGSNYPNHLHDWGKNIYRTKDSGALRITPSNLLLMSL